MREILFRGKRSDNGEWVEGQLLYFKASVGTSEFAMIVESCEWDNANEWFNLGKRAKVIPESVSEFTAMTDKYGKKIFEGDIIKTTGNGLEVISVVLYGENAPQMIYDLLESYAFGYRPKTKMCGFYAKTKDGTEMFLTNEQSVIEVIGNIHDNPELLKGGEAE